jgi:hypothetical protein
MSDQESQDNQPDSSQRSAESPDATERKIKDEKAIHSNTQAQGTEGQTIKSWRIGTTLRQGWRYIKSSEFTNLAVALATVAIAIFTWLTYEVVYSGSQDTQRLIIAAENQARAAEKFAASAASINAGIGTAVDKLNLQATELNDSVKQAARLAGATEQANANVINSDRPWMGAAFGVEGFAAGSTPIYSVTFVNSGKRPARITLTDTLAAAQDFGNNPVYKPYEITPSVTVVVPGQGTLSSWKAEDMNPMPEPLMKAFTSDVLPFRIYAKIEYTDIRTGTRYWTHACWRFTPKVTANKIGFSNCNEYNDAK